jgi:Fur family ferric uptake transcriptional regulator
MMKTLWRGAANRTEAMAEATKPKRIEAACREKGMRVTGQRRIIAQVVAELRDHPDVNELHRRVAEIDERISLSTVYRTLKRFEELGILERHEFRDGRARYESTPAVHHDHLIDLTTGRILEFYSEDIERLQNEIARKLGYHVVGHRLELYVEPLMQKASRK